MLYRIRDWVETYIALKPGTVAANNSLIADHSELLLRVQSDESHKIEELTLRGEGLLVRLKLSHENSISEFILLTSYFQAKMPWTGGRHSTCHLRLFHTSVSLFHFLICTIESRKSVSAVESGDINESRTGSNLCLVDCGSSVGTSIM